MTEQREPVRENPPARRTCANEGCGRPAMGNLCEVCGLEWSLYHREERAARRASKADSR